MEKKIFKFLRKNYGWMVAITTGTSVVLSHILRFIKYMYSQYYFNYYGLSYEMYDSSELGFLYNFGFSILLLLCLVSLFYCYFQFLNNKEKPLKIKTIAFNIFLILISNIFIVFLVNVNYTVLQIIANIALLIVAEGTGTFIFYKSLKNENEKNADNDICNKLKILPFYIFLIIIALLFSYGCEVALNKSYRITNDDKVILYSTEGYYLVLDCEIEDNKLTIHKGKQTKINNEDVKSQLIEFDEIKIE